jgi:hypothetical protein
LTPNPKDVNVENAVLRGTLWLVASALRDYHETPHIEIDKEGRPMLELIVPESLPEKAKEALERAKKILREPDRDRTP